MKPTPLPVFCIAFAMGVAGAAEFENSTENEALELDPIVVVASKRPTTLSDVVGQVTVIDASMIEQYLVENSEDLFRYEPGVNLEGSGTRFGANAFNIRGIGGNRVAIEIDGVPVRDRFAVGSYSDAGRLLMETDRIKRLEVLHGPASTLYGADSIGGVIAITTWDPRDLTATGNGRSRVSLRGGYQGARDSVVGSAQAAWSDDRNGLMFAATWRNGHELENQAAADVPRDELDWSSADYFVRYTRDTRNGNLLRFTAQDYSRDVKSGIQSLPGNGRFRNTTSLSGDDRDDKQQLAVDYEFNASRFGGVVRAYDVSSRTEQVSFEERARAMRPVRLERRFRYAQDFWGVELNLFSEFSTGHSEHRVGAGVEYQHRETTELRDGFQQSLTDGTISKTILGENLPVRDFPISRTSALGIYLQDDISFGSGLWKLVPAVRYDRYRLEPRPDDIYLEDNPHTEAVSISSDHVSPRLGILYQASENAGLYAQYVNGFRSPPFEDANIGLDIPLFRLRAIPNPDLEPETSNGYEFGLRYITGNSQLTVALFDTYFDDFIESKALIGVDPQTGTLLFQSRNIKQARIYGLDLRLQQELSAWHDALSGWTLSGGAFWSRGNNEETGQPLNSVSPPQAVLGLSWRSADEKWTANLLITITAEKDRIDETASERFHTPSWTTLDLSASWKINEHLGLNAGIFNLTDKTYWHWSDVSVLDAGNPMIDLLSRPGRNFSVSARLTW